MSYSSTVLADSPAVFYRCNDTGTTTTAVDSSGNSRNGTYQGTQNVNYTLVQTALIAGDATANSVLFASGYMVGSSGSWYNFGTGDFTLECWFKGTGAGVTVLAGLLSGTYMGIGGSGVGTTNKFIFAVPGDAVLSGATTINDGVTHHLVACRRSGNTFLYVDGVQDATQASTGGSAGATGTFGFGAWETGGFTTNGNFEEFAVYGTGLTAARVLAHYQAGSASGTFTIAPTSIPKNHANNITLTLTGSGTSWNNGTTVFTPSGVTGVTKISQNVTSTTAATVVVTTDATHTGTLTITESVTGTATATTTVATATLAISPTSGLTGTTPTLTLTGTNTVWTQETAAGLFTESGGTGASIGTPTVTTDTAATAVLTVGSAAGTLTITDSSTGATATFTASLAPTIIPVNDSNWFWAPYAWRVVSSTYGLGVNPGPAFKLNFNGTSALLNVDVSALSGASIPAASYPIVSWRIDAARYQQYQLLSSDTQVTLGTGLANSQHALVAYLLASDAYEPRWTGVESLKITGLQVDGGTGSSPPVLRTKRMIAFGDSITESAWCLGTGATSTYTVNENSSDSYLEGVAEAFDAEEGNISFGGQSWDATWNSDVPKLPDSWTFYYSTNSRLSGGLLTPTPDYLLCNMGTNGSVSAGVVTTWLGTVRTAAGSLCKIFVIIPFSGANRSVITTDVAAYQAAHPTDPCYLVDLGNVFDVSAFGSYDGIHPDVPTQGRLGAMVARAMQAQLTGGGGGGGGAPVVGSGIVRGRI